MSAYAPPGVETMGGNGTTQPRATCPTIWVYGNKGTKEDPSFSFLPCKFRWMEYKVDVHISTAFCTMMFQVVVPLGKGQKSPGVLQIPMTNNLGTVSEIFLQNESKGTMYVTAVVPSADTKNFKKRASKVSKTDDTTPTADPSLVQVNLPDLSGGEVLNGRITWFQPLEFREGKYRVLIPTRLVPDALDTATGITNASKATTIFCNIVTGNPGKVPWCDNSHPMMTVREFDGRVELKADSDRPWANQDFSVSFNVWNETILCSLNVQMPGPKSLDTRGTFCLSVAPPNPKTTQSAPRSVVFLLDRSGSMAGEPIDFAKRALIMGLNLLKEHDYFNIIAYDHNQMMCTPQIVQATRPNVTKAQEWVSKLVPGGMTDILTPLMISSDMVAAAPPGLIPYIFLITDGKVENEKDICNWSMHLPNDERYKGRQVPRISTFAIGPYCNHVFLKQLALSARGMSDVALRPDHIQEQMERLLIASEKPVLFDIHLGIDGIQDVELYPFPIPDLFCGGPLVVSGKFSGAFPSQITLNGILSNGARWTQSVATTALAEIPLDRVFIKQQLDMLTAKAWLMDDPKLIQRVVDISVRENIPSAYTTMVGFEVSQKKYNDYMKAKNAKSMSAGKVAAIAIGGTAAVAVVGIAVFGFGDLAATMGNLPVGEALNAMADGLGEVMGEIATGIGELAGDMADCCGEVCGNCDGCGECFGTIAEAVGECCGCVADCFG